MKKVILLLVLIISLFANDKNGGDYQNNIESSNQFIIAKISYKEKDYKKSYLLFKKLFQINPSNIQINYYYAKSASKIKKYDEAVAAYERVLIAKDDFVQARAEYAKVLAITGQKKQASNEFKKVLTSKLPDNVRKNIEKIIKNIDEKKDSLIFGSISFSYLYDDNINNVLEDSKYNFESENDYGFALFANVNHLKNLSNNDIYIKNNILLYKKRIIENTEYDIGYAAYKPSLIFRDSKNKQSVSFGLGIEKLYSGDDSNFKTFSLSSEYKKRINRFLLSSKYIFQKNLYDRKIDKDRDFTKNNIAFNINIKKIPLYKVNIKSINLNSKFGFYRDTYSNTRENINKDIVELKANIKYILFYNMELFLEYKYKFSNYKDYSRTDNTNTFSGKLSKSITKKDNISLLLTNKRNESDLELYNYDKNLFNLTYVRKIRW